VGLVPGFEAVRAGGIARSVDEGVALLLRGELLLGGELRGTVAGGPLEALLGGAFGAADAGVEVASEPTSATPRATA
jgi:hypothetical protein